MQRKHRLSTVLLLTAVTLAFLLPTAVLANENSANESADVQAPTFHNEVSRLLQKECQVCHRPNGANLGGMVAPMALVTYEQTRPWARSIARKVQSREMPPWHASEQQAGHFKNERSMSDAEVDVFVEWAKAGAPVGDPAKAPTPREWPGEGWLIGEPDLVLTVDEAFFVADDVEDQYIYLKTTMTKELLAEDRMVKAVEFRPGSPAVHHIIVPGLGGIAPGNDPTIYADGIGSELKAGKDLQWQMHYHKEAGEGTGVWDKSQVALKFYGEDEVVRYEMQNADLSRFDFALAPGDNDISTEAEFVFEEDSKIVAYLPHMHLRGKAAKYVAHYPDGKSETLLEVPKYDFNWQTNYEYGEYKKVPAGTKVVFTSWWDNSAENPHNPDPTATVRWGEPTTDEMSFGFLSFITESNSGGDLFGQGGDIDLTAVVAFTDESRDGKMQLEETPEQMKSYFALLDRNKDKGIDMDEAKAGNAMLEMQRKAQSRSAQEAEANEESEGASAAESGAGER